MDLIQLSKIAIKAAHSAGKIIQQYENENVSVEVKKGGESYASQVVTVVDKACETAILAHLLPTCDQLGIALLSEETEDDGSRFEKDFFWCIDPMDGTLAFINKRPGFSVSIALVSKDGTPSIGIVYDPSTDTLYHAIKGHGAFKNGNPWKIKQDNKYLSYVTDQKLKDSPRVAEIENLLSRTVIQLNLKGIKEIAGAGSVLNAIFVLENGPACMFKFPKKENGGGSIWDFAATACIYQELGLSATDFKGERLDLNRKDSTFMNKEGVCYANLKSNKNLPIPMIDLSPTEHPIHSVTSFQDLVSTPYHGSMNAICWKRELIGDFSEIIDNFVLSENIRELDTKELQALELSEQGQFARDILLKDLELLSTHGAAPVLNLIKCYERDDSYPFFPTDVYSFHVDRAPIPSDTFLCTYYGASSDILPNAQAIQKVLIPEIRAELKKLYDGPADGFDSFLKENFFDLHYQATPEARPINLGIGHLWRLACDAPGSPVPPCVHRAPIEKTGQTRLMIIC